MLDEFAVAGTACSSVVSVLRALHEDGFQLTCTPHPPAGHPPILGSCCRGTSSPMVLFLPCLALLMWGIAWLSAK